MRKCMMLLMVLVLIAGIAMAQPGIAPTNPITHGNFAKSVASCDGKFFIGQPGRNNVEIFSRAGVYVGVVTAPVYQLAGFFGEALAVTPNCTTLVVGAKGYDATGAIFIYDWNSPSGAYQFVAKKTASGLSSGDGFGQSVAVTDDATTVFGGAYLKNRVSSFVRSTSWTEHTISMPGLSSTDYAGYALCVAGNDLGVGVPLQFASGSFGAFYIHRKDVGGAGNWGYLTKFTGYERLGYSCDGSGPRFIVGAPLHNFNALPPGSGAGQGQGVVATIRRHIGGGYTFENTFAFSLGFAECGASVGISGTSLMFGCPYADEFSIDDGTALGFSRYADDPGSWLPELILFDETPHVGDRVGFSSAVGGGRGIAGAPFSSEVVSNAGMAYYNQYQVLLRDSFENGDTLEWVSTNPQ